MGRNAEKPEVFGWASVRRGNEQKLKEADLCGYWNKEPS
jgi:hypothetical protein